MTEPSSASLLDRKSVMAVRPSEPSFGNIQDLESPPLVPVKQESGAGQGAHQPSGGLKGEMAKIIDAVRKFIDSIRLHDCFYGL